MASNHSINTEQTVHDRLDQLENLVISMSHLLELELCSEAKILLCQLRQNFENERKNIS
jgi:hypothetical protein